MTKRETFKNHTKARDCDSAVYRLALQQLDKGVPLAMFLDRLMTFAIAHGVRDNGPIYVAEVLRDIADNVERGALAGIEAQGESQH